MVPADCARVFKAQGYVFLNLLAFSKDLLRDAPIEGRIGREQDVMAMADLEKGGVPTEALPALGHSSGVKAQGTHLADESRQGSRRFSDFLVEVICVYFCVSAGPIGSNERSLQDSHSQVA